MKLPSAAVICALITVATAAPGLLRVPRVYNAVITSNQNLSPSRAFPVIQPVIHRTAVGYVPPLYYTQIAPHFAGPEVVHYPPANVANGDSNRDKLEDDENERASSASRLVESTSFGVAKDRERAAAGPNDGQVSKDPPRRHEQPPFSFYPNYHSLYYEPYVYTYNSFNPHVAPGTYYVDYRPDDSLAPIPPTKPKNADTGRLLPGYHDERSDRTRKEKERIPDVPPPPPPTSVPKRS